MIKEKPSWQKLFSSEESMNCKALFMQCSSIASKNLDWDSIVVSLKDVEKGIICDCLGEELYQYLCKLTEKKKLSKLEYKLLEELRFAIVKFTEFELLCNMLVIITNKGVLEFSNDGKTQTADRYLYNEAKWGRCYRAYDALQRLIYKFILPNKDNFPETILENSAAYQKACKSILYGPDTFMEFYPLQKPGQFKAYLSLLPYICEVEECDIEPCLCPEFYCEIKKQVSNNNVKECLKSLLKLIRRYIANQSLLSASTLGILQYTGEGWKFVNQITSSKGYNAGYMEMHRKQCAALAAKSNLLMTKLKACLEQNKDKEGFELYKKCCESVVDTTTEDDEKNDDCECPCGNEEDVKTQIVIKKGTTIML